MAKTVLVADADEEVRKQLFLSLSTKGYEVKTTDSASNVIRELEKESVGVILLDVELSGMKAYEIIPLVKKIKPKLPIIVMSASSSVELAQKIRHEGIFFYAMKPIDTEEVVTVVQSAFRKLEQETQIWERKETPSN